MEPKMTDPFDMSSQVENGEQSRGRFLDTHQTNERPLSMELWRLAIRLKTIRDCLRLSGM